ncbi:MAG TPA: type II secretion system protein GspK [Sedimentisphaerales bacterium]|nr:type II secretion system protein GspK [Sedimentisphaerales bacterium]
MRNRCPEIVSNRRRRPGVILLVTLVLLVVLATLGYTLTSHVSAQRRRCLYAVDYQAARYGCDSAVKYALATLEDISPQLISRPNEPDFSDLFHLSEQEYQELLDEAARIAYEKSGANDVNVAESNISMEDIYNILGINYVDDANYAGRINDVNYMADFNEPGDVCTPEIRGPYGPPWPLVSRPAEFEIGSAKVRIEIEDENAKYPISWMLLDDKEVEREVAAGFETFCEWMDVNQVQIETLKEQMKEIGKIKPFKLEFKQVTTRTPVAETRESTKSAGRSSSRSRRRPTRYKTTTISVSEQVVQQAAEFSRLFHSSLLDTELLTRPTIITESRKESPLMYMGLWGSGKVNINTAPRQVLEAAFVFGGDSAEIAQEIIRRRREKPFADIGALKEALFSYSDSVTKCENYITTTSNFFTIRVTAVSGVAQASAVIAISKEDGTTKKIAVISG